MTKRPKIAIELTAADTLCERVGWAIVMVLWVQTIVYYYMLPTTIPIHYNIAGKADYFGNKALLFMLPTIATLLFIALTALNKIPHSFNYPKAITADNALVQYTNATRMLRYLKLAIAAVFSLVIFETSQVSMGQSSALGIWFLPAVLACIFAPVAYFTVRSYRLP